MPKNKPVYSNQIQQIQPMKKELINQIDFDRMVKNSLAELPKLFQRKMDNLVIMVEDYPRGEIKTKYGKGNLLGIFIGVPLNKQHYDGAYSPHQIILYRKNIESICNNPDEIKEEIRTTLIHEIGHYFGFNEKEIRELQGLPPEPED